jgi:putative oxidoreductase
MNAFTQKMGIPWIFALLAIVAEFFGSLGVLVGLLTRVAAFGICCVMIVAVLMGHVHNGFFMNWSGHKTGEGFEFHILAIAIAVALIIKGGGRWSLDRLLAGEGPRLRGEQE